MNAENLSPAAVEENGSKPVEEAMVIGEGGDRGWELTGKAGGGGEGGSAPARERSGRRRGRPDEGRGNLGRKPHFPRTPSRAIPRSFLLYYLQL